MFTVFDKNGDGYISASELNDLLHSIGKAPTERALKAMIKKVDKDGDGYINFSEFLTLMARRKGTVSEFVGAFKVFDKDNSGKISANEFREVFNSMGRSMSDEDIEILINEADLNGDGVRYFHFIHRLDTTETNLF